MDSDPTKEWLRYVRSNNYRNTNVQKYNWAVNLSREELV